MTVTQFDHNGLALIKSRHRALLHSIASASGGQYCIPLNDIVFSEWIIDVWHALLQLSTAEILGVTAMLLRLNKWITLPLADIDSNIHNCITCAACDHTMQALKLPSGEEEQISRSAYGMVQAVYVAGSRYKNSFHIIYDTVLAPWNHGALRRLGRDLAQKYGP